MRHNTNSAEGATKRLLNQPHTKGEIIYLDNTYAAAETPPGLKGIVLRPHQQVVVQAMLDLEWEKCISFDESYCESSAFSLREELGSGKTFEILALVLHRPIPRARWPARFVEKDVIVQRKFLGNSLLRQTMIIVGASVLGQWKKVIRTHTSLKVFTVGNYAQLKKFQTAFNDGTIKQYDIILVKNGVVTNQFLLPGEKIEDMKSVRSLVLILHKMLKNYCVARVVYDDFNVSAMPGEARIINTPATWYVSGTKKRFPRAGDQVDSSFEDFALEIAPTLGAVQLDSLLFSNFAILCDKSFREASARITHLEHYHYEFKNPADVVIGLLRAFGHEDTNDEVEAANAGAINTLAKMAGVGLVSPSMADVFHRMMGKKYNIFAKAKAAHDAATACLRTARGRGPPPEGVRLDLDTIITAINSGREPQIPYQTDALMNYLSRTIADQSAIMKYNGTAIENVLSNAREGMCQVCNLDFCDIRAVILRCCSIVVCDDCSMKTTRMHQTSTATGTTLMGNCPNCRAPVDALRDMIYLSPDINLENITEHMSFDIVPEESKKKIDNPKMDALVDIIRGKNTAGVRFERTIPCVLQGTTDIPPRQARNDPSVRVLVFASYDETIQQIENVLTAEKIPFYRLGGTAKEISTAVSDFKRRGKVLLVNSRRHCAGLNLEFCTDLIYFHKIIEADTESQVAARLQRMGRTQNARIHYLAFENETVALMGRDRRGRRIARDEEL